MRRVNKEATKILEKLRSMLEDGDHIKIDNSSGTFMPVSVEKVGSISAGPIKGDLFSVAHYGEQNGDLMRDPDVVFLRDEKGNWFPDSFRNDYLGLFQTCINYGDAGEVKTYRPRIQTDIAVFVGTWMKNIKNQQNL